MQNPTTRSLAGPMLSSAQLKVIAIVAMTLSHAAVVGRGHLPYALTCLFEALGGMTFPIMAFLLVEGYRHTHDIRAYGLRLGAFALISQVPFTCVLKPVSLDASTWPFSLNVMFCLLCGLALLWADDHLHDRKVFWLVAALLVCVSYLCDWGVIGPMLVFALRRLWPTPGQSPYNQGFSLVTIGLGAPSLMLCCNGHDMLVENLPGALSAIVGGGLATLMCACYDGTLGRIPKWLFYAYYPLHICVLGLLAHALWG